MFFILARNESFGLKAVQNLQNEGIKVNFHQLDIEDSQSIKNFSLYLKEKYEGIDILINNAAIAYHHRVFYLSKNYLCRRLQLN